MSKLLYLLGLFCFVHLHVLKAGMLESSMGVMKRNDPVLTGLKWGNWGSRPYEYYWASNIVSVKNKKVIDLGVGLPSQYNWYSYVVKNLQPSYYVGIDFDPRINQEIIHEENYDMLYMGMSDLKFNDKTFDVAFCISTFEHLPYQVFMKAIQEANRVLKDDGVLVFTLDEQWDKNIKTKESGWNDLERSLIELGLFSEEPFGLPDFIHLIKDYFVPLSDDIVIDTNRKTIFSPVAGIVYYGRSNRDQAILYSPECFNSCVSYAVLKKVSN